MFYNSSINFEYNDCISRGACSVSPSVSSMREVMFTLLRQIIFYIVRLRDADIRFEEIEHQIISEIALIDAAKDLSEAQVLNAFSKEYNNLIKVKNEYHKYCKDNNLSCRFLKNIIKFSPRTNLSSILKRGNKEFLSKYNKVNKNEKFLLEILSSVAKSVCVSLINLYDYGVDNEKITNTLFTALDIFNSKRINSQELKEQIGILAECDVELLKQLYYLQNQHFGNIKEAKVSFSTRPHKAILVSGSNLNDLDKLLNSLEGKDIDVYTNGYLLIAHAFEYFSKYKNLKGQYGSGVLTTILDFATFPGAILLTKNEAQNIEYLYRGRLFTTDEISPQGVVKIENDNFQPLIDSAIQAKGFAKGQERNSEIVGYNPDVLNEKLDHIFSGDYKKVFIIGFSNLSLKQKDYFEKFFELMPQDTFAITFSYNPDKDNVLAINIGNDYPQLYNIMQKIIQKFSITSDKLVFFLTKCDVNSLSNIIYLKNSGAKNLFLSDCPPLIINPAVLKGFNKLYGIREITTPKDDLKNLDIY